MKFFFFTDPTLGDWILDALESRKNPPIGIVVCEEMSTYCQRICHYADRFNIPVFYAGQDMRSDAFVRWCRMLNADVFVAFGFGRKIPPEILALPTFGVLNVHPSLLPSYRGAAPCFWAIRNGETESGATIHLMDDTFDTGDILLQKSEPIYPNDTAGTLQQRLMVKGAELLIDVLENVPMWLRNRRRQDQRDIYEAPRVNSQHLEIKWCQSAVAIECLIRAANPHPIAHTTFEGLRIGIVEADALEKNHCFLPGEFQLDGDALIVGTGKGILKARVIQINPLISGTPSRVLWHFTRGVFDAGQARQFL
mgnify:CR=1 FL=1